MSTFLLSTLEQFYITRSSCSTFFKEQFYAFVNCEQPQLVLSFCCQNIFTLQTFASSRVGQKRSRTENNSALSQRDSSKVIIVKPEQVTTGNVCFTGKSLLNMHQQSKSYFNISFIAKYYKVNKRIHV